MEFRTAYGKRKRLRKKPVGTTLTKQAFAKECDVNNIVARYMKTGVLDHLAAKPPVYGDVEGSDLHTLMNVVAEAHSAFEEMPDVLRARFSSPHELVSFVSDEGNRAEAVDLGLVEPLVPGVPVEAPVEPVVAPEVTPEPPAHIPT